MISVDWLISTSDFSLSKGPFAKRDAFLDASDAAEPEDRDDKWDVNEVRD